MRARLLTFLMLAGCGTTRYGVEAAEVWAASLQPSLSWSAFPGVEVPEFGDVTYEVCVWREDDGRLVYDRRGLKETSHTMETPLEPRTEYRWSVRPWFVYRGATRAGPWAQLSAVLTRPREKYAPVPLELFPRLQTAESAR